MGSERRNTPTAGDIRKVAFPSSLRGYDPGQVDELLDQIADALDRGERVDASWLAAVNFRTALRGYSKQAVDAFLEHLRANL